MIALVFSPMPHTKSIGWYLWPIHNFAQPPGETSHCYAATLCFSTAAAAAPPSASHPRHRGWTPLHRAAEEGHAAVVKQLISAGATVDAADIFRRGPGRVFRVVLGVALTRWRKGLVHWQVIFVLCFGMLSGTRTCCLRIHFCDGMGLLKFG